MTRPSRPNDLTGMLRRAHPGMDQPRQYPPEIGVVIECRRQHRERRVWIGMRWRDMGEDQLEERRQILARRFEIGCRPAMAAGSENRREIELRFGRVERGEQIEDLVVHLLCAGVRAIDLVDDDDRPQTLAQRLPTTNLVCGIGPSAASTSTRTPSTMLRMRSTSPPKSAWPGVSTMLIRTSRQTTEVHLARIVMPRSRSSSFESERPLGDLLVGAESAALVPASTKRW